MCFIPAAPFNDTTVILSSAVPLVLDVAAASSGPVVGVADSGADVLVSSVYFEMENSPGPFVLHVTTKFPSPNEDVALVFGHEGDVVASVLLVSVAVGYSTVEIEALDGRTGQNPSSSSSSSSSRPGQLKP